MANPTIAVVDDDDSVRDSISIVLEAHGYEVKTFATAKGLLTWINPQADAIVVTDLQMPEMDGMALIAALRACLCLQPVIVVTGHGDIATAVEALKGGVADFFEKPIDAAALIEAIERVQAAVEDDLLRTEARQKIETLSPRERQVLQAVVAGKSNKQVAAALGISPRTVEIYRAFVMRKLRVNSLAEMVRMYVAADQP